MTYIPKCIDEAKDLKGKKVIVRVDFNVAIHDGMVYEPLRIDAALKTIEYLHTCDARVILISHIETKGVATPTLLPVYDYLKNCLGGISCSFSKDVVGDKVEDSINNLADGDILLLENLRIDSREKDNDDEFAKILASYADVYVNDAFPVCHRKHASVVGIPKFIPGYAGFNLINEIKRLQGAFNPEHPFVFILGGAKFETKMPLIQKFLPVADTVFLGGALVNDVYKSLGYEVGTSVTSGKDFDIDNFVSNPKLIIPADVVTTTDGILKEVRLARDVEHNEAVVDVGPDSIKLLGEKIANAKFVLWNGPLGYFEKGFKDQTMLLAKKIIDSGVNAVIGGGDTVAAIQGMRMSADDNIFVSTGGGAMLDYLNDETLPGIEAIKTSLNS